MKPIYIFRHISYEGPGYFLEVLERRGIPCKLIAIDRNDPIPESPDGASGLVFMGGGMSVNDPSPWIEQELRLIRLAAARKLPVLGHCLGGQLISKALGGTVEPNPVKEIGWFPVERSENATARRWLGRLPQRFDVFHWHGETFTIPPGAVPILQSRHCRNQAFVLGNILALQCHVEMTADMVTEWAARHAGEIARPTASVQSAEQMTVDLEARIERLHAVADIIYDAWLHGLAPY